jgi:hypothetical protein
MCRACIVDEDSCSGAHKYNEGSFLLVVDTATSKMKQMEYMLVACGCISAFAVISTVESSGCGSGKKSRGLHCPTTNAVWFIMVDERNEFGCSPTDHPAQT